MSSSVMAEAYSKVCACQHQGSLTDISAGLQVFKGDEYALLPMLTGALPEP